MSTNAISSPTSATAPASKVKRKSKKKKLAADKVVADGGHNPTIPDIQAAGEEHDVEEPHHASADDAEDSDAGRAVEAAPSTTTVIVNGRMKTADAASSNDSLSPRMRQAHDTPVAERDSLKSEVIELRRKLEASEAKQYAETTDITEALEEATNGKEQAEAQYNELLGRVNAIRTQLGERLKSYSEELNQSRSHIEELGSRNSTLESQLASERAELARLKSAHHEHENEVLNLRGRANLSQRNWIKERDELIQREAYAREEFETAKQAMQDWELLALEERAQHESLTEKVADLEEQLVSHQESYGKVIGERDTQAEAVEGLQRALQEIQEARKMELRKIVEKSQHDLDVLQKQVQVAEDSAIASRSDLDLINAELERALPFEKEAKEKNLLIRKLRHEAVILNDHLTKALRFLRQRNPEDMVDRQLVTNHLLHFITLDRADARKFQILQLIAALLSWTDEEKEQAGLARPGASSIGSTSGSLLLNLPLPGFRRTPSQTTLNTPDLNADARPASRESLAELWSDFLEREAQEGSRTGRSGGGGDSLAPSSPGPDHGDASR